MSQEFKQNQGLEKDLKENLDFIAQELENNKDNLQEVLDDAIDIILYVSLPSKEPIGFDIGLTTGGPGIQLVYSRGRCQLRGSWGSLTDEKDIDNEICETILDYLEDLS